MLQDIHRCENSEAALIFKASMIYTHVHCASVCVRVCVRMGIHRKSIGV